MLNRINTELYQETEDVVRDGASLVGRLQDIDWMAAGPNEIRHYDSYDRGRMKRQRRPLNERQVRI